MHRSVGVGIALIVTGGVLALSPMGDVVANAVMPGPQPKLGVARAPVQARVPPSAAIADPAQPATPAPPPPPAHTQAQRGAARDAIARDGALRALARGTGYRIAETVPWAEADSGDVVGADVTVIYDAPIDATATLPAARFDAAGHSYERLTYGLRVRHLTRLHAMVDLRDGARVIDVAPEDGATEELASNQHFRAHRDEEGGL